MKPVILVAGGTGNLGERIIKSLIKKEAQVRALVRPETEDSKKKMLEELGAKVIEADFSDREEMKKACEDVSCVVSALAGLHDVIVVAQSQLLDAAVSASVPRFIPSDFASDFARLEEGDNRNFDLRLEFHKRLDASPITSTSIMNGAFADILSYNTPLYNLKNNTIGYWGGDPGWFIDFTTMDNTAEFTASAALDSSTPKVLRIASFQITPNELQTIGERVKQKDFKLIPMGSLDELAAHNKKERAADPEGEKELYPRWQGSQYMHSMFSVHNEKLDNERYPGIKWATAEEVLAQI